MLNLLFSSRRFVFESRANAMNILYNNEKENKQRSMWRMARSRSSCYIHPDIRLIKVNWKLMSQASFVEKRTRKAHTNTCVSPLIKTDN